MHQLFNMIKRFISARSGFYNQLFSLLLPIVFQNLITSAVSMADVLMLGRVNQTVLSASSLTNYIKAGVEIEHILPQTPTPEMLEQIPEYDRVKIKLGNLTLIEKSMNDVIKNKPYSDKVLEYEKTPYYITKSLAKLDSVGLNSAINRINTLLKSYDHWDAETVADRQQLLYELSLRIWTLE